MQRKKKSLSILFIGNSHTYYNDMPLLVKSRAEDEGYECRVSMLAHAGWYLEQHAQEPDVRFNILYGNYDYVVLQEHAHPFGAEERFLNAAVKLNAMIRKAGSTPVIFECWSRQSEPDVQTQMNEAHRRVAECINAPIAEIGENWWGYQKSWPELNVYADDGEHASIAGSEFAAKYVWETIWLDMTRKNPSNYANSD